MQTQPEQQDLYDAECLDIEVRTGTRRHTVLLSGALDSSSAHELCNTVNGLILDRSRLVMLDLAELTLCDAGGISAMLQTHRSVSAAGGRMIVRGASGLVRRVLSVTGADKTLDLR